MAKRKTEKDYHDLAESLGGKFIGPKPTSVRKKCDWVCAICGEIINKSYDQIRHLMTCQCYECSNKKRRIDIDNIIGLSFGRLTIVDTCRKVKGNDKDKRLYCLCVCTCGGSIETRYDGLKSGNTVSCGCYSKEALEIGHQMSIDRRYGPNEYNLLAEKSEKISKWLGPEVHTTGIKTWWQCVFCYEKFDMSYDNVLQGNGCRYCANAKKGDSARLTTDDYHLLATNTVGISRWLGPEVKNTNQDTWWECALCGKPFERSYSNVRQALGDSGCIDCIRVYGIIGKQKLPPLKYHELAEFSPFFNCWLGPEVNNVKNNTWWECRCGEKVFARYDHVRVIKGCRKCSNSIPKSEFDVIALLKNNGVEYEHQKWFDDCRSPKTGSLLFFDFYLPTYNLLLETNGKQHYEYVEFFHRNGPQDFEYQCYRDEIKRKWAANNSIDLLIIPYYNFDVIEIIISEILT